MKTKRNIVNDFIKGKLITIEEEFDLNETEWNNHPDKGVQLKHLITGKDSSNKISCHLVKIEPNCKITLHSHSKNLELHEVVDGYGEIIMANKTSQYNKGAITIIPDNIEHEVIAGKKGLYILAKFIPALK